MRLNPLHPAASVVQLALEQGFRECELLAFTRRSTIIKTRIGEQTEVLKVFFGSDHVIESLPEQQRSSAYGFYWYASKSDAERTYELEAVSAEIEITKAMTGVEGFPEFQGAGLLDGKPFMRLGWITGTTFKFPQVLSRARAKGSISLLAKVASALHRLHAAGYVHRDIYQENIVVDGASATILDLGVAKRSGKSVGPLCRGPEPHWPPEYLTGFATAEASADVYSLGVLLYRTITGDIPRPWSQSVMVEFDDPSLTDLVLACLRRDPGTRPAMGEVAAILSAWTISKAGE